MKTKILFFCVFILSTFIYSPTFAEKVKIDLPAFSRVSLRVPAELHIEQGSKQSVEIVAKSSTIDDIITEVKDRTLSIRFPGKNFFKKRNDPGKIEIFITVPEIDALSVSGSGDILADEIKTRILELVVSGSGDIIIKELKNERIKATISGSGNIVIKNGGIADEFDVSISGSGNVKAEGFEANEVTVHTAGSGNCSVTTNGSIKARIAGSGNVYYKGNPSIDSSIAGSGGVKKR